MPGRLAIDFGTYSTSVMFGTGIYPVVFKQDPRYRPASKKGFGARTLYAASRVFVGVHTQLDEDAGLKLGASVVRFALHDGSLASRRAIGARQIRHGRHASGVKRR